MNSERVDILDEREAPLGRSFMGSLALHASVVLVMSGFSWWHAHNTAQWGSENAMGGSVGLDAVDKIPLPTRSITPNRLANDVDSSVPSKPEKVEKKKAVEDEDAIPLSKANRKKKKKDEDQEVARVQRYTPVQERTNQVYSPSGASCERSFVVRQARRGRHRHW